MAPCVEEVVSPVIPGAARFLVGLIGAEIGTSLSPQLHEREADELGLRYFYQLIDIDELGLRAEDVGSLIAEARQLGFRGLNMLLRLRDQGLSILLVEQNATLTFEATQRCLVMENGRAVLSGTAAELRHNSDVRRIYLGI
jgi:hypothetical protein